MSENSSIVNDRFTAYTTSIMNFQTAIRLREQAALLFDPGNPNIAAADNLVADAVKRAQLCEDRFIHMVDALDVLLASMERNPDTKEHFDAFLKAVK